MAPSNFTESFEKDLRLKNYCESSIGNYVSQVKMFLFAFKQKDSPKHISESEIKEWLLKATSINGRKHRLSALKLFYKLTVKQPMKFKYIEYPKSERKLPFPMDVSEIQGIFNACKNLKHRAIIGLLYGCGLRISEAINLKISDIDSKRMVISIIAAKGKKDRQVTLSDPLLKLLRDYFKEYKPNEFLFNGQSSIQYSERSINEFLKSYGEKAGIKRNIHAHLLRHSWATHSLESGVDISILQKLLGHNTQRSTQIYTHVSTALISKIKSPLEAIKL